jgi:Ca2+-binding EF-hand superfamily protein
MGLNPNAPSEALKVKKIVQQMDSDGSGALDFDEFYAWWRDHLGDRMAL